MTLVIFLCSLLDHPVGDYDLADWELERQMIASGSCIYFATDNVNCIVQNNLKDYSELVCYEVNVQE